MLPRMRGFVKEKDNVKSFFCLVSAVILREISVGAGKR